MIKIFVGCAPDGHDAESCATLEHSLRSRTSAELDITWMVANRDPGSLWCGWDMRRWSTPFSGYRWRVPAACGFQGRAIYLDSDLVVLGDIAELWETELGPGQIAAARSPSKFCVTLWDCQAAKGHMLDAVDLMRVDGHERQTAYFRSHPGLVRAFGARWNYLDSEDRGTLGQIVHFTDLTCQPHLNYAIPRLAAAGRSHWYDGPLRQHPRPDIAALFEREFAAAKTAGYTVDRYLPAAFFGDLGKRSMGGYRANRG